MPELQLNLRAMTAQAFGYSQGLVLGKDPTGFLTEGLAAVNGKVNVDPYQIPAKNALEVTPLHDLYGVPLPPDYEGTGLLGLPVFARIDFLAPAGWARLSLLDPIVEIGRQKNILMTDLQGGDGSVKEFISKGDYAVTIRGILASDPMDGQHARRYPTREVQALQEIIELDEDIPVSGRLFKLFGIKNLVIRDHSWPPLPGFTNLQAYELRCVSDKPIELVLNRPEGVAALPAFRPANV
jgi:hypothetical protein